MRFGLLAVLLLAAPEDEAARKLRIAWASLYEWKETNVKDVTLHFRYRRSWKTADAAGTEYEGVGQAVVVGEQVVRRHYPALGWQWRTAIDAHLNQVLFTFVRKSFEETFPGGARFQLVKREDGTEQVGGLLLRDDRIVGRLRGEGVQAYETVAMGGGYAIVGAKRAYTAPNQEIEEQWKIQWKLQGDVPVPQAYVHEERRTTAVEGRDPVTAVYTLRIEFVQVVVNAEHPIVVQPAARDALKAAWARRYVLPNEIRIQGRFAREIDTTLRVQHWRANVKGEFLVWGMDERSLILDEDGYKNDALLQQDTATVREHFRWFLDLLHDRPFEKEFEDCGFLLAEGEDGATIVHVLGHGQVLAFRLEEGRIVGWQRNAPGDPFWWSLRLKALRDGRQRIEAMSRPVRDETYTVKFRYSRSKGIDVPRSFEFLAGTGICTYLLKKVKVEMPDDG